MQVDFTAGAMRYAEVGLPVFLLAPGSKLPFISKANGGNGVHDATTDADQIKAWGRLCPNGNVAIACGEIVVLDVDPRNGGDVTIRALAAKGHPFPTAPRQRTGNGGYHLIYRNRGATSGGNNKLGPGIDVKAAGGYIVAAPSWTRPSESGPGGSYVWEVSPFDVKPPPLPIWMVTAINPPPRPVRAYVPDAGGGDVEPLARFVASSGTGQRNNRLHWAACRVGEMAARGMVEPHSAGRRLLDAAICTGYPRAPAVRTINSAFKARGWSSGAERELCRRMIRRDYQQPINFHQPKGIHMADYPSQSDRGRGALFKIPDEERKSDKHPIYRGDLQLPDGSKWKLSGWVREDKNGRKFLSLSAEPFEERTDDRRQQRGRPQRDETIPF